MAENFASLIKEQKETNKRLDVLVGATGELVETTGEQTVATGAAATEDKNRAKLAAAKSLNLLKTMAKGITGLGKSFALSAKARLKGLSGGLLKFIKATALAALLVAALGFLESQTWKDMKKFIVEDVIPKLINFYKNTLRPFFSGIISFIKNPSWQAFKDIFDVDNPLGLVLGLAAVTALFAPGLLFAGLSLGVTAFKAAAKLAGKGLSGLATKLGVKPAKVGKAFLKAAKFLGPVGLAIAAGVTLFDGFSAGIKEFKESGNFGAAVREGAAGALSSLTFGLVSQETISGAFTSIGDKFDSLSVGVSAAANAAWTNVKDAIPTEEQLKESFTKLKDNLSPLKDIKLPEEISFSAIKDSVGTMATALNDSFANLTGIDVGEKLKNISTAVSDKVSALASSFENITGITIPSFGDIGAKLKSILPSIGNPFSAIMDSINSSAFFSDAITDDFVFRKPFRSVKGVLKNAFESIFGSNEPEPSIENRPGARAMGGAITGGKPYLVGEMGPELILPSGSGQVMNAQRTEQILSSGISRGMQGMGSGGPAIVNAPVNTVNNSQSNMTSTSTPMFHPSPLLGAVNVAA